MIYFPMTSLRDVYKSFPLIHWCVVVCRVAMVSASDEDVSASDFCPRFACRLLVSDVDKFSRH